MSAEKMKGIITKLAQDAERTNDPARLWRIVEKLNQQGAWAEARHVALRARELQMAMERVNG
jgi:hypothetical protein